MAKHNLGKYSSEGRQAFMDGVNPEDVCPYHQMEYEAAPGVWKPRNDPETAARRRWWIEGWEAEGRRRQEKIHDEEVTYRRWLAFAENCPWREIGTEECIATRLQCNRNYCAPAYFMKEEE